MKITLRLIAALIFWIFPELSGQVKLQIDTFAVNLKNRYVLSERAIVPGSERVVIRDRALIAGEYQLTLSTSVLSLSDSISYSLFDTLIISYQAIRIPLKTGYKNREPVRWFENRAKDSVIVVKNIQSTVTPEAIFGNQIEKSGTLIRGFTVGTNNDFSLQSGFRLQISGKLSDEIEVVAALTDENTPLQPAGNTERLDELDKVFIQLKHKNAVGFFGDYDFNKRWGEFGVVNRKLQGLMAEVNFSGAGGKENYTGFAAIAGSKGKFTTNKFNGNDGVQGPYLLFGENNEKDIIIIAGSEKVYIDGNSVRRGENADYIIDYANAQITFTSARLITSASRITVDFEYTDRKYSRNLFGAGASGTVWGNKVKIGVLYFREGDDESSPIDISFSEEDKKQLAAAGDNRNRAVKSGAVLAKPDSLGRITGLYARIDTTINGTPTTIYRYAPGSNSALYNVSFTYVPSGSYKRQGPGNFVYVGSGLGSYEPIIYLPLPELKQFTDVNIAINPYPGIEINTEFAMSSFDRNRFSAIDEDDNIGTATNIKIALRDIHTPVPLLPNNKLSLTFRERFKKKGFNSLERFDEVEFSRDYNIQQNESNPEERLREIGLTLKPDSRVTIRSTYGSLRQGDTFNSLRLNSSAGFTLSSLSAEYNHDLVISENTGYRNNWLRQKAIINTTFSAYSLGVRVLAEEKREKRSNEDTLRANSLKFLEIAPEIGFNSGGFEAGYEFLLRHDYLPAGLEFRKESTAKGHQANISFDDGKIVRSTTRVTLYSKEYTKEYQLTGALNNQSVLVRNQSTIKLFDRGFTGDVYYEAATQKTALLEKVFVQVQRGLGNYRFIGDLNGNGIQDETEYEPASFDGEYVLVTIPSDELYPVVDLKTSFRTKILPEKIFGKGYFSAPFINAFSFESYWRIEENTREEDISKIYFLQLHAFRNEKVTIRGSQLFQQSIYLFENDPGLSVRFFYSERRSLAQFSGGLENGYLRERNIRVRMKLIEEIGNQSEVIFKTDRLSAVENPIRNRIIESEGGVTDFSYRPYRNLETGFKIRVTRSTDYYPENPSVVDLNSLGLRVNYSFTGSGRLRAEVERSELLVNNTDNYLPFELTEGNVVGKNFIVRINFDYRISVNLQASANYEGRKQGESQMIHTARAEMRAFF